MGAKDGKGALVQQVEDGGPAARAGLKPGDVIVEFGGQKVSDNDDLVERVVRTKPGTSVPVAVLRNGKSTSLTVTVEELDLGREGGREATDEDASTGFGMTLQDLTPDIARQLRVPAGTSGAVVVEVEPRGAAARAFIQPRDIVIEVNRTPGASAAEAIRELQKVRSGQIAMLLLLRANQEVFVTVRKE
jgi:serine protease Do